MGCRAMGAARRYLCRVDHFQRLAWSPSQATGAPNTHKAGDFQTAWASLSADGQREWLCLEFAQPVVPKSVQVYENDGPGAIDRVTVFTADGKEVDAWRGNDPTPPGAASGVSEIPLTVPFAINKLTLYLNSPAVRGWNEIDAVGLVSKAGDVQWARRATASSSYGAPTPSATRIEFVLALLPPWADAREYGPVMRHVEASSEVKAVDGRGWPLIALWCERDPATGHAIAGALGATKQLPSSNTATPAPTNNLFTNGTDPLGYGTGFIPSSTTTTTSTSPTLRPTLPIRLAWQGFLADVAFYALALFVLRWLIVRPWRLAVELSRLRNGRCIVCGYDLGYDFPAGCPECGWRRARAELRNLSD